MPRAEDIAWKFVVRLEGKKWRCPYCKAEYAGSVTRVRSHLLQKSKEGIAPCKMVLEYIRTRLTLLLDHQIHHKDDIAWILADKLEDNKWRCHHCIGEFSGDLKKVKDHLLGVPNEENDICTKVPDHVRTVVRSLLNEVAEDENSEHFYQALTEHLLSEEFPQPESVPQESYTEMVDRFSNCIHE